jgi:hypothetical protein
MTRKIDSRRANKGLTMLEPGHHLASPFPFILKKTHARVVDELCTCGYPRSQHADTFAYGHGHLRERPNFCSKFTWVSFISES